MLLEMSFRCYSSQIKGKKYVKAVNKFAKGQEWGCEESVSEDKIFLGLCDDFKHLSEMDAPRLLHMGCRSWVALLSWCLGEETFWTE